MDIDKSFQLFNVGVVSAAGLLHLLLFAFYPRERANLCFCVFALGLALNIFIWAVAPPELRLALADLRVVALKSSALGLLFQVVSAFAFLAFLYTAFARRIPRYFWLVVALRMLLMFWQLAAPNQTRDLLADNLFAVFFVVESLRVIIRALLQRANGAWIVGCGVLLLTLLPAMSVIRAFGYGSTRLISFIIWQGGVLGMLLSASIYLARNFAITSKRLEAQLLHVKELSRRELEHEQQRARMTLIEAENARRAQELEEARQLQLSMLPKAVPRLPNLEIAAYMKPATEVGGDYYDFHVASDGTLTIVVGDATGHGLKAGTIVTATKSLFNNLADETDIAHIFKQSSAALKRMNLRGLFMAMTMLKIKENRLAICTAGMPPMLIFRAREKCVEEVTMRAVPLGSLSNVAYKQQELTLYAGDTLVLMSDGFPEMFNEQHEMLGYMQARETLIDVAAESPQAIINRFIGIGEQWAGGRPPDDDVTFVVLKVKGSPADG